MTVRQLESLIRLSEAYARLYCESKIETYHVKEAVRLLRTSITKVDKDPIAITTGNEEELIQQKRTRNQS